MCRDATRTARGPKDKLCGFLQTNRVRGLIRGHLARPSSMLDGLLPRAPEPVKREGGEANRV